LVNARTPAPFILRLGYGLTAADLPPADLVVSAGGETLAANAAAAQMLGVPNIFCGRVRRVAPEHVRIIIVSLERFRGRPNHLIALPPSPFEVSRPEDGRPSPNPTALPKLVGVLVGGDTGAFAYSSGDWENLVRFMREAHDSLGVRWLATTSRRSDRDVTAALARLAADPGGGVDQFIDYRAAGPGTLADILAKADAILVTADSTTMISEAVAARLPVVGVLPDGTAIEEREEEYRGFLTDRGWYRPLTFSELTPARFLAALSEIAPRQTSALDELATALAERLPQLL
jgi:hypothetical protein